MLFLLGLVFVVAALSLLSYVYCWQDIKGGRPHIISLRQILVIMDRHRIDALLGGHGPGYYYRLTPAQVAALLSGRRWFYRRECAADLTCLLGSWLYMTGVGDARAASWFVLLAGLCQGINLAYSLWLIGKWRDQLKEEIDNSSH